MAALLGINWPVNSVGVLPDVDTTRPGYLLPNKGDETKAQAALVNAKVRADVLSMFRIPHREQVQVILDQYRVKHGNFGATTVVTGYWRCSQSWDRRKCYFIKLSIDWKARVIHNCLSEQ
jgi:hypothetical protein